MNKKLVAMLCAASCMTVSAQETHELDCEIAVEICMETADGCGDVDAPADVVSNTDTDASNEE